MDDVRDCLSYLVEKWQDGVRFDSLVFLTSERDLRKKEKEQDYWKELEGESGYDTEWDMCQKVWERASVPEEMRHTLNGKRMSSITGFLNF